MKKHPGSPLEPRGWRKLAARALDLVYPPACAVCSEHLKDGRSLCQPCAEDLPRLAAPFCNSCGETFQGQIDGAFDCPNCSTLKFAFEFARPAMVRDDRTLDMVHRLKYGRELHLAAELGRLADIAMGDPRFSLPLEQKWPLVPVPLHRSRLNRRMYNQAEEIALALAKHRGLEVVNALGRIRSTETQTRLTRAQRLENLRGAFSITKAGKRRIASDPAGAILVDDVLTTGSTVDACAKVLRRAGFKRVVAVTVMRG